MKKIIAVTAFAAGLGVIAFASLKKTHTDKPTIDKKAEKQKKQCTHTCIFG